MRRKTSYCMLLLPLALMWLISGCLKNTSVQTAKEANLNGQEQHKPLQHKRDRPESEATGPAYAERRKAAARNLSIDDELIYVNAVINLTNVERSKAGLHNLRIDDELMASTALRAREIERKFDHARPDGRSFDTALSEFGVKSYKWCGENIVHNTSDNPADALTAWMNSSGHRANILKREYTHIGAGVHRSGDTTYVVQIFVAR